MTRSRRPGSRAATGEQYRLRAGEMRAQIGQVGAVLREFSVAGVHYTETWPDVAAPPMSCGVVLMPWPNRVAGGRWTWRSTAQQLDITEPRNGNAIHGLLGHTAYQPTSLAADHVTLAASIYPQHGWPFTLDTSVRYALTDRGLCVTHEVTNVGGDDAVFGCGAHPYLRVGDVPVEDLTMTIRADTQFVTDDAKIPTGTQPLSGPAAALPTGARVGDLHLDAVFTGLEPTPDADGERFEHRLEAPDGHGVMLWAETDFRYAVGFTPTTFPGATGPRRAVAMEPMTCPTNALGSGEGLIGLQPGETWSASWGLSPF